MAATSGTTAKPAADVRPAGSGVREAIRGTARGGLLNLAGAVVAGGGGLVVTWLVAAGLGVAAAGQFFAATSAFLLVAAVARLGTPTGLIYWVARLRGAGRDAAVPSALRVGLYPAAIASAVLGAALYAAAPLTESWNTGGGHVQLLRVLAVFLPAAVLMEALLAATRGYGRMRATVFTDRIGRTAAQLVALAAAVALTDGPGPVAVAWALPYLPAAALAGWWLRRLLHRKPAVSEFPDTLSPASFWAYTAPRALASVMQLALQRMDILLVAGLLGFAEAAVYTVATRFVVVGQLAGGAVGSAVQPRLATCMSRRDYAHAQTLYQVSTAWIVATAWPVYLVTAVCAPWYLRLFGGDYATDDAVRVVWLLAGAMLLATGCGVVDSVLVMAGRTSWQLINVVSALVVNVAVDVWLIPRVGIIGAAIGWAAAVTVNNLLPLAQLAAGLRLHPFGRGTMTAAGLAVACFGVLPVVMGLFGAVGLLAGVALATIAYACSAWRLRKRMVWARP